MRASRLSALAFLLALPVFAGAQVHPDHPQAAAPAMSRDDIVAFAKVNVAIGKERDSTQTLLALARNAKFEQQTALRDTLHMKIVEILHHAGMSDQEFQHKTFVVSTDGASRKIFDSVVAQLTGVPTPGQVPVSAAAAAQVKVPDGPLGTHIGHVMNGFADTPGGQGLLPVAMAEARVAIQHAGLAARAPTSLDGMKLHAGHVINAMDPTLVTTGPGLGYGFKKAATGVATHIDLAAKTAGASTNAVTHANHVATAARSAVTRADQVIALAQKIQAATTAEEAAALVNQLVPLTQQLVAGVDLNGDGRITWDGGEGGLQQAQEHVTLLLAGEK
ncbi:MAG TPA: hypothetical protein VIV65_02235 [Gemmatimonadaceae bacterium]